MLGATSFVWGAAARLLGDQWVSFFAAALFAALAPTLHLGSFATYDAPALLLLAMATWCAAGVRSGQHVIRRITAAGVLLALANATKYATVLYDPTVLGVTVLGSWPDAGWKLALRRAALLACTAAAILAVLLALGGPGYLNGIRVTTTGRAHGTATASLVFADAWSWTAVVLVPAVIAAVVGAVRRRWPQALLLAVLALSALLAPTDQARIQTATSLSKHVDFGAWFAAIAAGYLLSSLSRRRAILIALLTALVPMTSAGTAQAAAMIGWPDVTGLVKVVRPMTAHGGHFLVETTDVLLYYLPGTTWRQWSNTQNDNLAYYQQAIARHYFSVVILSFNQTPSADYAIALDMVTARGYQLAAKVRAGTTVFYVWQDIGRVWDHRPDLATAGSILPMTAEPVLTMEEDRQLREMTQRFRALGNDTPAELGRLYASPALQGFVRAVTELRRSLAPDEAVISPPDIVASPAAVEIRYSGTAHKVSVSMPADLTTAVQQRVGRGKFSQYVTEAVSRQLELDLLAELSDVLAAEHGPVPGEYLAEARAAWPEGD